MLAENSSMVDDMTELHQIYYDESHLEKIFPFALPYYNEGLTIFFENEPISKLVLSTKADKIGVTSWKLQEKMRKRVGLRQPLTQQALESDYQVLSFTRNSQRHGMLAMANTWHPHFLTTIKLLWQKLGYKMPGEAKNPIYQNHYAAKTEIYKDYVQSFLIPAMKLTENDEELNKMMLQPSGYGKLQRNCDLKSVKEKLGMSDYPLSPFILERCPSLWYQMKGVQISYL
jgi:hypothetical protein